MSNREEHVKFVSNLTGTTVSEIALVVSVSPWSVLLHYVMIICLLPGVKLSDSFRFVYDFALLVVPTLLSVTALSECMPGFLLATACITSMLIIWIYYSRVTRRRGKACPTLTQVMQKETVMTTDFITWYRSYINIAAAVGILAVDFHIFPRRHAKTENYGTGLMDAGVGAFIIANAIVSQEARRKNVAYSITSMPSRVMTSLRSVSPLIVLGLARLVSVKVTDYQEHISEYGVHWNFFWTLAAVRVLSTCVMCMFPATKFWVLATVLIVIYQYMLTGCGLGPYILYTRGGRESFIEANREGIASCLGYLALYFIGIELGRFLFKPRSTLKSWLAAFSQLIIIAVASWLALMVTENKVEPVSRRTANLSFVIWMLQYNVQLMASFLLVQIAIEVIRRAWTDTLGAVVAYDSLLHAVSFNSLLYFLLANLATGAVNFSINTLKASGSTSLSILCCYMLTLSLITNVMYRKKIKTKFW